MISMKRFITKSIPCILILMLVLASPLDITDHTNTYAKAASSDTAEKNSGYFSRSSVELQALNNSNNICLATRSMKLIKGNTARLNVLNVPANYSVSFHSSNSKIASVSSSGKITGKKNGEASIIATIKSNNRTIRKLTCSVEVGPAAVSIVIPKSKVTMSVGKSYRISYIVKSSNSVEVPNFKSSNKKVATVSKTGVVTSHSAGKAVITATIANGKSDKITIVVNK